MGRSTKQRHPVRHFAEWGLVLAFLSVLELPPRAAHQQEMGWVLVRVEDRTGLGHRNRLVMRDLGTGRDEVIYRSQGHIPFEAVVSPDGRYVSFLEVVGPSGSPKQRLVVIELSDRSVRSFGETAVYGVRGIREHVWCCGPEKLAILTGTLGEPGPIDETGGLPLGVFVIDVRTGAQVGIEGVGLPQQMHWAPFDSSLYIKGAGQAVPGTSGPVTWPVYRYHVPSSRLSLTTHVGVFFSPDGRYYFDTGVGEGSGTFRLYRSVDDADVTGRLRIPRRHLDLTDGTRPEWMPGADHVLILIDKPSQGEVPETPPRQGPGRIRRIDAGAGLVNPDRWNLAVDAETGRVIERFQGDIRAGWKTNAPAVPVERQGGVVELIRLRRR